MSEAPALQPPSPFAEPWELRTYAMAAALVDRGVLSPDALPQRDPAALRVWLTTVQQTLLEQGVVTPAELDAEVARQAAVAASRAVH